MMLYKLRIYSMTMSKNALNKKIKSFHNCNARFFNTAVIKFNNSIPQTPVPPPQETKPHEISQNSKQNARIATDLQVKAEERKQYFNRTLYFATYIIIATILGSFYWYDWDKKRADALIKQRNQKQTTSGRDYVGGYFTLVETKTGKPITDSYFRGKWMLMYFGFTNCPDICPIELKKTTEALNLLNPSILNEVQPIFMSVDPPRDSCDAIENYLKQFHPKFLGLTGTPEQIRQACRKFRIYYSPPVREFARDSDDYQLDHSIFVYLMDPYGNFSQFFSKNDSPEAVAKKITETVRNWKDVKNNKLYSL